VNTPAAPRPTTDPSGYPSSTVGWFGAVTPIRSLVAREFWDRYLVVEPAGDFQALPDTELQRP
jgi:hypothetical protein